MSSTIMTVSERTVRQGSNTNVDRDFIESIIHQKDMARTFAVQEGSVRGLTRLEANHEQNLL